MKRWRLEQTITMHKIVEVDAETAMEVMAQVDRHLQDDADIRTVVVKNDIEEIGTL